MKSASLNFKAIPRYVLPPKPELPYAVISIFNNPRYNSDPSTMLYASAYAFIVNANPSNSPVGNGELGPRALANGATLRILCLGASITYGYGSTDGNGYRYGLRGALVGGGNKVNMIGSLSHGTMNNNHVEGWVGYRIAEVAQKAELSLPDMPNLVLINAGSKILRYYILGLDR
jgi:hypothetical protein